MSEHDIIFKDMFPEEWTCPYCFRDDPADFKAYTVPRNDILQHLRTSHSDLYVGKLTWEQVYKRLSMVGGV